MDKRPVQCGESTSNVIKGVWKEKCLDFFWLLEKTTNKSVFETAFVVIFVVTHKLTLLLSSCQGAVVGLVSGLVMAFWIGIGSFVMRMSVPTPAPALNATALPLFDNITTTVMNTTAKSG